MLALAQDPEARLRDIGERVGITERAVHRLLSEMGAASVISRRRKGRRNRYSINRDLQLRHPIEEHRTIGDLIDLASLPGGGGAKKAAPAN
ncbi:MAG: AsnC family transcriptional regulator [Candidatus Binatia bacterium]|nr:AsnC family transcriptional regulator [Candidatus Binatia bacterium]